MRIWSKKLIKVLPTKQLCSMRYELGDMIKQYPNIKHGLVKFANDYDIGYLVEYFRIVCNECKNRNINMKMQYNNEIIENARLKNEYFVCDNSLIFKEDNEEYLQICKWNLYEKYLRKMITDEEWQKIEDLIGKEV